MSDYGFGITLTEEFAPVVARTRDALSEQGFGILTEIDVAATMKAKLDVDLPPYLILGACNPPLAHRAIGIDASIGLLLPCNVVIRALDQERTLVEVMDPNVMVSATGNTELIPVAEQARIKLTAALDTLAGPAAVARCV
jgi:uncharacterized protein (DUF302 family)